jgi:hypothetical protein
MWLLKNLPTTCFRPQVADDSTACNTCCGPQVSEEVLAKLRLYEAEVLNTPVQPGGLPVQQSAPQPALQQAACSQGVSTSHVSQVVGGLLSTTEDTFTGPRSARLLNELGSAAGQHILLIELQQEASSSQHLLATSTSEASVLSYHGWRLGQVGLLVDH